MEKENITSFMIKEHGKILALLAELKNKINTPSAETALDNLDKNLNRHILAEEKVIIMLESKGKKFKEMVIILQQHEEIRLLMDKISNHIKRSLDDFSKNLRILLNLMKEHIKLENEKFYPLLDKTLNENEKKFIFEKLHESIIGNIMI